MLPLLFAFEHSQSGSACVQLSGGGGLAPAHQVRKIHCGSQCHEWPVNDYSTTKLPSVVEVGNYVPLYKALCKRPEQAQKLRVAVATAAQSVPGESCTLHGISCIVRLI